mgnify:CR=1 FL=1
MITLRRSLLLNVNLHKKSIVDFATQRRDQTCDIETIEIGLDKIAI